MHSLSMDMFQNRDHGVVRAHVDYPTTSTTACRMTVWRMKAWRAWTGVSMSRARIARFVLASPCRYLRTHQLQSQARTKLCWKCMAPLMVNQIVCDKCRRPQPVRADVDYFAVLTGYLWADLPRRVPQIVQLTTHVGCHASGADCAPLIRSPAYRINVKKLKFRFLDLQRLCHPDHWSPTEVAGSASSSSSSAASTTAGNRELELAQQQSSWLNKAFGTLRDPMQRAQYLLRMYQHDMNTEHVLSSDPSGCDLLQSVMETREQIDDAQTASQVEKVRDANHQHCLQLEQTLETVFDGRLLKGLQVESALQEARRIIVRLKYLHSIEEACKARLFQLQTEMQK